MKILLIIAAPILAPFASVIMFDTDITQTPAIGVGFLVLIVMAWLDYSRNRRK